MYFQEKNAGVFSYFSKKLNNILNEVIIGDIKLIANPQFIFLEIHDSWSRISRTIIFALGLDLDLSELIIKEKKENDEL